MLQKRFRILFLAVLLPLAALPAASGARAQSMTIQPVTVQLDAGQMAATLTVVNQSAVPSSFQVRAYDWHVENGEDQLTPTDVIALSPPLGTIAPNASQLIRLVLRRPARDKEETYRVWLDQIPAASEPGSVRIALRLSIPIFALPPTRVAPDLQWHIVRQDGKFLLTAANAGTRHQTVRNLALTMPDGVIVKTEGSVSPYVLAGATRSWRLVLPATTAALSLHLTATSDDSALDQTVAFTPP